MTEFLEQIDNFINQLTAAQGSLEDQIYLQECDVESALAKIKTMSDYQEWGEFNLWSPGYYLHCTSVVLRLVLDLCDTEYSA